MVRDDTDAAQIALLEGFFRRRDEAGKSYCATCLVLLTRSRMPRRPRSLVGLAATMIRFPYHTERGTLSQLTSASLALARHSRTCSNTA
jgi:hypothetical protein